MATLDSFGAMALARIGSLTFLTLASLALAACVPAPSSNSEGEQAGPADSEAKPEVVCQHVRDIAGQDGSSGEALDTVQRECVQTLTALRTRYQTFTQCVEQAGTAAALQTCEAELAKPPPLLGAASPTAKLEAVCDHVMSLVTTEIEEVGANPQQLGQLRDSCLSKAGEQLEIVGPDKFEELSACILAAANLQALEACGKF